MERQATRGDTKEGAPLRKTATGEVVAIRGGVVDVRFKGEPPGLNTLLLAGPEGEVRLEVMSQVDEGTVRWLAFTSTAGMARGDEVTDTGEALHIPEGPGLLRRVFDVVGQPVEGAGEGEAAGRRPLLRAAVPIG